MSPAILDTQRLVQINRFQQTKFCSNKVS
ncbi:hypothetical protein D918_03088 [Trichuris suis]|nr:hypothetical protein D918_03088 [Trichuris suis]